MCSFTRQCPPSSQLSLPAGDVLIHCGDWVRSSSSSGLPEYEDFLSWLCLQPHSSKVLISGNKESCLDSEGAGRGRAGEVAAVAAMLETSPGLTYLRDSAYVCEKAGLRLKVWGSPWSLANRARASAFQLPAAELSGKWESIPADTDILVTHSPALGRGDTTKAGKLAGCPALAKAVDTIR